MNHTKFKALTLKVLERAHELLDREGGWTKNVGARDANGKPVMATSPDACSFCAGFAIARAISETVPHGWRSVIYNAALMWLTDKCCSGVARWNDADEREHIDVLCAFDLAILKVRDGLT
jgi:hypothetical protein